jgi:predicted phage terminase large subunit-like protein
MTDQDKIDRGKNLAKVIIWQHDIFKFLKEVFPHHFNKAFAPFHAEIYETLKKNKRVAIAAPRRFGKSEIITFGWVMWNLLLNPHSRFTVIIGNNYDNALKFLAPIKEELEHNSVIHQVFGKLKSEKWAENEIEITWKKKIIVGGNDFKIRGQKYLQFRPDLVVIDDAEDDELVRNDVRRRDFEHWFLYGVEPALSQDNSQIVVVGTILHRDSQLSKLSEREGKYKDWESKKYRALDNGSSIWETAIPKEWLENERSKDPYKFSQEYQNDPVPYEYAMFKPEYFDDYKKEDLPRDLLINITVDLACTDKTYSDFTVIMPVGVDALGDMWVLPYERVKYEDPDKIIDKLLNMYLRYAESGVVGWKFGKVGIEKTGFQRFLIKNFVKERKKRNLHFPVEEIDAKGDKVTRISRLQPWFAGGDIHVRPDMIELKEELLDFPRARHDDVCLIAGTKIATLFGDKNIEDIKKNDLVITPFGVRKVINSGCTGYAKTISRLGLCGTPNHQVFMNNSFANLDALCYSVDISRINIKEVIRWKYKKLLSLMESSFGEWEGRETIILVSQQAIRAGGVPKDFMLRFGNFITKHQFRKVMRLTISTGTLLITTLLTFAFYRVIKTVQGLKIGLKIKNNLQKYAPWLLYGTGQKKGSLGIKNIQLKLGKLASLLLYPAKYAEMNLEQSLAMPCSALQNVVNKIEEIGESITKKGFAQYAEKNFSQENSESQEPAHLPVVTESAISKVFNLTVGEDAVYYANGILVSNCDCLSYHIDIISKKPILKTTTDDSWKITPERQRRRILRSREDSKRPLIYNRF